MKILLIDDSWEFTDSVKFLLERDGHTIDVIDDSDAAHCKIENLDGYKLILLDLMITIEGSKLDLENCPETGILLYTKIRKKYKKIPIIIVSALNESRYKKYWSDDNLVKYVSKPLSLNAEELKDAIESFK
jgi:DNA-binding response OmpR family regulator